MLAKIKDKLFLHRLTYGIFVCTTEGPSINRFGQLNEKQTRSNDLVFSLKSF